MGISLLFVAWTVSGLGYHVETVTAGGDAVHERFTSAQLLVLQKLNRADLHHLDGLTGLVVPDTWFEDPLAYSPLPRRYPAGAHHGRLVVIHLPGQAFGAYEHGTLVRWGPISTGSRANQTPSGTFNLNWRARRHVSTINPTWVMEWAFNFENQLGLAMHQKELPGHPASHGCVRLLEDDARWLFGWADPWSLDLEGRRLLERGTPVFIVGAYDFDSPPPWRSLEWLASPVTLPDM